MYNWFTLIADRFYIYSSGLWTSDELLTPTLAIDGILCILLIATLYYVKKNSIFWFGSRHKIISYKNSSLWNYKSPIWKPYFKKDGYYGMFTETTFWS